MGAKVAGPYLDTASIPGFRRLFVAFIPRNVPQQKKRRRGLAVHHQGATSMLLGFQEFSRPPEALSFGIQRLGGFAARETGDKERGGFSGHGGSAVHKKEMYFIR
jgi:hypothetical protein